jgi:transposase
VDESLWVKIRLLFSHEKMTKRAIARNLGVSRDLVDVALNSDRCPQRVVSHRGSMLDPYRDAIDEILEKYPTLSIVRIFEKLRALGYPGQISILRDLMSLIRPRRRREAFLKRETLAGEEAQVDWGSCGHIQVDGTIRALSVFVMVLSYSRLLYVEFTVSQEMEDFLRGHVNAFESFGGRCPKVILYDNLRSVVRWRQKRLIRFNNRFQEFAGTYLFEARPCNPRRGNEKPRAETGVRYVKQNFLAGREFRDLTDLRLQAFHWLRDVANIRIHQTTRERPIDRFERERDLLQVVPRSPYDTRICRPVLVTHQIRVKFQRNTYTVPPGYVSRILTLKAGPDRVWIYDGDQEVASHTRSYGRFRDIEEPAHVAAILETKPRGRTDKERDKFLSLGGPAARFLEGLVQKGHGNPDFHISKLLGLVAEHGSTPVLAAIEHALRYSAFGADIVQNILYQRCDRDFPDVRPNPLDLTTRPDLAELTTDLPELTEYDHLTNLEEECDQNEDLSE